MTKEIVDIDALLSKMNREPTPEEAEKIKKNIEVFENISADIKLPDGHKLLMNLRKEARRQKAAKACADFETQIRRIEDVPYVPMESIERELADSFELIEED